MIKFIETSNEKLTSMIHDDIHKELCYMDISDKNFIQNALYNLEYLKQKYNIDIEIKNVNLSYFSVIICITLLNKNKKIEFEVY